MELQQFDPRLSSLELSSKQVDKLQSLMFELQRQHSSQTLGDIATGTRSVDDPDNKDRLEIEKPFVKKDLREWQSSIKAELPEILDAGQLRSAREIAIDRIMRQSTLSELLEGSAIKDGPPLPETVRKEIGIEVWKSSIELDAKIAKLRAEAWDKIFQKLPKENRDRLEAFCLIDGLHKD